MFPIIIWLRLNFFFFLPMEPISVLLPLSFPPPFICVAYGLYFLFTFDFKSNGCFQDFTLGVFYYSCDSDVM